MKIAGTAAGTAAASLAGVESACASGHHLDEDRIGVLTDYTQCIGCRRCEWACAEQNDLPFGELDSCDDTSVFEEMRRPSEEQYTVVNRYPAPEGSDNPLYAKVNCLHCEHPPCVSACIVGALRKNPKGPVTYDAAACIGCRYCMIACPFQIPAYEYDNPLTPRVMKCTLCFERSLAGEAPACVAMCPQEALTFGRRTDLLELARDRIRRNPDRYEPHVFGEYEGGGTSWLMIGDRDFGEVDLPTNVPDHSPAEVTERIQHGIFRGFSGPLMVFGMVSLMAKSMGDLEGRDKEDGDD